MTFLAIIVAILAIITLAQIVRVFELSGKLSENDQASIDYTSNKNRGFSWILFGLGYFAFFIYCVVEYGQYLLPESASLHGETIDMLMDFNLIIIITVFFITHCLLFFFSAKYHWKPGQKAAFISHNNKLELMWTSAPAIVLAVIIIYGLSSWNEITEEAPEGGINI
jgi:cytochrome c oxidase subunit 2